MQIISLIKIHHLYARITSVTKIPPFEYDKYIEIQFTPLKRFYTNLAGAEILDRADWRMFSFYAAFIRQSRPKAFFIYHGSYSYLGDGR